MFEDDHFEGRMGQSEDAGEMDVKDREGGEVGAEGHEREEVSKTGVVGFDEVRVPEVRSIVFEGPVSMSLVRKVVREESEGRDRFSLDVEERFELRRDELASADAD